MVSFFNNLWRPVLNVAREAGAQVAHAAAELAFRGRREESAAPGRVGGHQDRRAHSVARAHAPVELVLQPLAGAVVAAFLLHGRADCAAASRSPCAAPQYRCSVVIPARNEAGNIEDAVRRTPEMGQGTEIIFIEGHSTDDTWGEIQRVAAKYPQRNIKVLKQQSRGKGGAVREAFAAATGDLLFILDADLTMPPEELPKFYEAARSGTAEFVNGVRLVYPMEEQAMQFLNMVANKAFGLTFSWLLGQKIKDTLCGTKVLFRADYEAIARNRAYFGDFDPFGDFDLLFGAAKLNLRMVDLPIRYRARTYGQTNIHRWSHGWLLLRMVVFAARRLKFIP